MESVAQILERPELTDMSEEQLLDEYYKYLGKNKVFSEKTVGYIA